MIYLSYGSDRSRARAKVGAMIDSLLAKKPNAEVWRFDDESFDPGRLEELVASQGLFHPSYVVVFDYVLADASVQTLIKNQIVNIAASPHIFIFLEEALPSALAWLKQRADQVQEFSLKEDVKHPMFNIFTLTDALGERDRKKLWVLFQQATRAGLAPEEIFWKLVWQVKTLLIATKAKTAVEANLKPFVFSKALRALKNFSRNEPASPAGRLAELSRALVTLYHDSRRGLVEFDSGLESWILRV